MPPPFFKNPIFNTSHTVDSRMVTVDSLLTIHLCVRVCHACVVGLCGLCKGPPPPNEKGQKFRLPFQNNTITCGKTCVVTRWREPQLDSLSLVDLFTKTSPPVLFPHRWEMKQKNIVLARKTPLQHSGTKSPLSNSLHFLSLAYYFHLISQMICI